MAHFNFGQGTGTGRDCSSHGAWRATVAPSTPVLGRDRLATARDTSSGGASLRRYPAAPHRLQPTRLLRCRTVVRIRTVAAKERRFSSAVDAAPPGPFPRLRYPSTRHQAGFVATCHRAVVESAASPTTVRSSWVSIRARMPARTTEWLSTITIRMIAVSGVGVLGHCGPATARNRASVVPSPGADSTASSPPKWCARLRIPVRPRPWTGEVRPWMGRSDAVVADVERDRSGLVGQRHGCLGCWACSTTFANASSLRLQRCRHVGRHWLRVAVHTYVDTEPTVDRHLLTCSTQGGLSASPLPSASSTGARSRTTLRTSSRLSRAVRAAWPTYPWAAVGRDVQCCSAAWRSRLMLVRPWATLSWISRQPCSFGENSCVVLRIGEVSLGVAEFVEEVLAGGSVAFHQTGRRERRVPR